MDNRTKIICTIGPASETPKILKKMIQSGMDCVRLNFSHGTYGEFETIIKNVRRLSNETGRHITVIQDLQGPKIRIGDLPANGVTVRKGQKVVLATDMVTLRSFDKLRMTPRVGLRQPALSKVEGSKPQCDTLIPVQYKHLGQDVKPGDIILVDDGLIELKVIGISKNATRISCQTLTPGVLKNHKGINVPTASISANPITKKDREDIEFGVKNGVDYVALSFVREAKNVTELQQILKKLKSHAKVIAKIERHEAIKNMEEIIKVSDAVMVARGDLGVEMPAEQVPLLQKKIIHFCNLYGKPVIVATQMLDSMVENPRATRAEISDAATAIFDHADAFMLSNETAAGKYPVEAAGTLAKVAAAVEKSLQNNQHLLNLRKPEEMPLTNAICLNACKLAKDINAKYIVAITRSGYTVREIAKYRPFIPIICLTPYTKVARQLSLVWGVTQSFVEFIHIEDPLPRIRELLVGSGLAAKGDEIVVCNAGFGQKEKLITSTVI